MNRFTDKIALVTGASRGIGRAIALRLASEGAHVVVNFARDEDGANSVVADIEAAGGSASTYQADVSDVDSATDMIKSVAKEHGKLDILVNNAGTTRDQIILKMTEDDWDTVMRINLKGVFNCSKPAVRTMMRKRYGRIINITSVSGVLGNAGQTNYSASKAGVIGFTRALAREVASRSITVNAVAPGFIPTKLTGDLPDDVRDATLGMIPLARWGDPDEIANAVAFLASDEAAYITGQTLNVDGGMAIG